jgi:hypothetical protein
MQRFGLTLAGGDGVYQYDLEIEHRYRRRLCRIKRERLFCDDRLLFEMEDGVVHLYHEDSSQGPEYPFDWSMSGLSSLQPRSDNKLLIRFKEWLAGVIVLRPVPALMISESAGEDGQLSLTADNFSSWYLYLSQEHQGKIFDLTTKLRTVLDGFHSFRLVKTGEEQRSLQVGFQQGDEGGEPFYFRFRDLSDGQRVLILLYTLFFYVKNQSVCLCLDEPENYLALPEIQPWLMDCFDEASSGRGQILFISHHPEIINYLSEEFGFWFEKQANAPVRVKRIAQNGTGLSVSELVARGWL